MKQQLIVQMITHQATKMITYLPINMVFLTVLQNGKAAKQQLGRFNYLSMLSVQEQKVS